ncbi:hypothetical protein [Dysgonomonas macrotermitis]|uniref:DUF4468 domain-containing protein n=1 Tax=Dysgonomonas macrotermitis TaxID=1346286 RepID=A0A1M5CET0_9BACT|nr:hypothetical protein [Dysgonomonas macrotermitis]SHF53235.1 hypothetical protein SAMN05444362_107145 [Dysgonomonas macrotermitis]
MKKLIYSLAVLSVTFSCNRAQPTNTTTEEVAKADTIETVEDKTEEPVVEKASRESLEKYFTKDGEWIQVKNALSADQTGLYVYFQAPDDVARNLRLRIQYGDAATYKFTIDGKLYTYKANRSKSSDSRFVEGSGSFNWYDDGVKRDDLKFLEALASSKNVEFKASGASITISEETKRNIQRTLDYFESMDGLLPRSNMVNIRRL